MAVGAAVSQPNYLGEWAAADAPVCYEYLDHTADVQLHSWGTSLEEAFGQQVIAMMALITELPTVHLAPPVLAEVASTGHDLHSLFYNFLDAWLYKFNAELFVCRLGLGVRVRG